MAIQAQFNGNDIEVTAHWEDTPANEGLDGKTPFNRWRRHIWRADVVSMDLWVSLFVLQGQYLTLTTSDYANRNGDYASYPVAVLERLTGRHESVNMTGVTAEFLVRV